MESEEPTLDAELDSLQARVAELEARLRLGAVNRPCQGRDHGDGVGTCARRAGDADRSRRAPHRAQPGRRHVRRAEAAGPARAIRSGRTGDRLRAAGRLAHRPRHHTSGRHRSRTQSAAQRPGQAGGAPGRDAACSHRARGAGRSQGPAEQGFGRPGGGAQCRSIRATRRATSLQSSISGGPRAAGRCRGCGRIRQSCLRAVRSEWEPVGQQIWRRARQLLLSRLRLERCRSTTGA